MQLDWQALYDETYDQGLRCGDSDSDDEGSLHEHEAESSDGEPEEETEKAKTKELEWDDSTLSFWVGTCNISGSVLRLQSLSFHELNIVAYELVFAVCTL